MKSLPERAAAVATVALAVFAAAPATADAAPPVVVTVDNATDHEGVVVCGDGIPAPPCGTVTPVSLRFYVRLDRTLNTAITVGWQLVPGTATAGADYSGPTTGSVTLPKNVPGTSFTVPLVSDGFNEPTEQFTVRLTSSSVPADISDTGTGTILDGTQIPADCSVSLPREGAMALACTGRPAGQQWRLQTYCFPFGRLTVHYGNVVTGNGQSTVDCFGAPISAPYFRIV